MKNTLKCYEFQSKDAFNGFLKLKEQYNGIGLPVIIGCFYQTQELDGFIEKTAASLKITQYDEKTMNEVISDAKNINIENFFKERSEDFHISENKFPFDLKNKECKYQFDDNRFKSYFNGKLKRFDKVYMAIIPTTKTHEIIQYLPFGGWNNCPNPGVQFAIIDYWNRKYDIDIVMIEDSSIHFYVNNPPQTEEESMKLAFEQYCYCDDVTENVEYNLELFAASLYKSNYWSFWWD